MRPEKAKGEPAPARDREQTAVVSGAVAVAELPSEAGRPQPFTSSIQGASSGDGSGADPPPRTRNAPAALASMGPLALCSTVLQRSDERCWRLLSRSMTTKSSLPPRLPGAAATPAASVAPAGRITSCHGFKGGTLSSSESAAPAASSRACRQCQRPRAARRPALACLGEARGSAVRWCLRQSTDTP